MRQRRDVSQARVTGEQVTPVESRDSCPLPVPWRQHDMSRSIVPTMQRGGGSTHRQQIPVRGDLEILLQEPPPRHGHFKHCPSMSS